MLGLFSMPIDSQEQFPDACHSLPYSGKGTGRIETSHPPLFGKGQEHIS
jgi:hypothetical protein